MDLQDVELSADLRLPLQADGLVIFVHGSGSGRLSPRNQFVAESLAGGGWVAVVRPADRAGATPG
jgi:predicted alpha/beta-hydrolase family hydrolase